jgi:hypothetical protein
MVKIYLKKQRLWMSSTDGMLRAEIKNEEMSFVTTPKKSFEKTFLHRLVKCIWPLPGFLIKLLTLPNEWVVLVNLIENSDCKCPAVMER